MPSTIETLQVAQEPCNIETWRENKSQKDFEGKERKEKKRKLGEVSYLMIVNLQIFRFFNQFINLFINFTLI